MKDYSGIIQDIKDNITENGKGEITGRDLREILLEAIGNVSVDMEELDRRIEAILGGENYDDIINSWAELEYFLSGLDESSNLAGLLSYKADKSDVYSRSDINTKLEDYTKTDDLGALAFKDEVAMSDIKNLEDALDKKLDKEGGEIENNLLVKGELKMGVLFVPTSDGEPSSYRLAIGELGEGADIPSSGEGGLGSVTIMLGDVPYYSDSNGIVRLPAYPTGGGSADSVEWSAVLNKPTTLAGYGITDALSKSGGTIEGDIVIEYALYGNNMHFRNNPNVDMILSPMSWQNYDLGWYNGSAWNTLIHSGNIGSQSVNYANSAGDANALGGYDANAYAILEDGGGYIAFNLRASYTNKGQGDGYIEYYDNGAYYNSVWGWVMAVNGFKGNADSATKLQAARTIWGQSFDGTANVSGVLSDVNQVTFDANKTYGIFRGDWYSNALTRDDLGFYAPRSVFSGNVLIDTTTDNGAKLNVNGNISASGYQLPTSAPSNPVSGGYYLYVGTLGAGATIS